MGKSELAGRKDYVSSAQAMEILGVRKQTLYAYVSRGLIRSIKQPGRQERLYWRDDIERMEARSLARSGHGAVAASAMNWGEPIIPTSITEITPAGPRYRGRLAGDLARMLVPFEAVAELLWTGMWNDQATNWSLTALNPELKRLTQSLASPAAAEQLLEIFALVTLQLGLSRGSVKERVHGGQTLNSARQIILTLVGCFGLATTKAAYVPMQDGQTIVQGLMRALSLDATEENYEAMQSMMTLFADNELSPGALAARVSASSGASLHACITSGICTSSGVQIGRLYNRVDDFLDGARTKAALIKKASELQKRGISVPGFVHPLYPHGDPRAKYLFEVAKRRASQSKELVAIYGFVEEMSARQEIHPRHELAILALTRAMGLPRQVPGALFVLARIAGWVAHVQEQRLTGSLLRPRGRFVGATITEPL